MFENFNWKRTHKKNYCIQICKPKLGTNVKNKLEGAKYTTNENKPYVAKGTVGEMWVMDLGKVTGTYNFADGTPITPAALAAKEKKGLMDWITVKTKPMSQAGASYNWAVQLPINDRRFKNFPVQTSWGDTLYANRPGLEHGGGDFIVCPDVNGQPNLNDVWIVNGAIFETTYDMRSFRKSSK